MPTPWKTVLTLNSDRTIAAGSPQALRDAIRRGADLRVYTEFWHDEHIDTDSDNHELIQETTDFRVTYLLENRWVAGVITLRQPISLPVGFGPRPSMSFFMYNEDGTQAIARPHLDGPPVSPEGKLGPGAIDDHSAMPKYHQMDAWDNGTNAPSSNFVYDFDIFRYCVREQWQEVYSHDSLGNRIAGSVDDLAGAFAEGSEVKVAIRGLCNDVGLIPNFPGLDRTPAPSVDHEVIIPMGSCYYYTKAKQFMAAANPVVRVKPAIPMRYGSGNWDFGWVMPRSDGHLARLLYDPYTLRHSRSETRCAMRWFVQK